MADKITPLFEGTDIPGQQNDAVVAILENMLERAKSGEVVSIAISGYTADDGIVSVFHSGNHLFALLGAIDYCKLRVLDAIVGVS